MTSGYIYTCDYNKASSVELFLQIWMWVNFTHAFGLIRPFIFPKTSVLLSPFFCLYCSFKWTDLPYSLTSSSFSCDPPNSFHVIKGVYAGKSLKMLIWGKFNKWSVLWVQGIKAVLILWAIWKKVLSPLPGDFKGPGKGAVTRTGRERAC